MEGTSTAQGRPHSIFKRAIQRRNVVAALAAARELPQLSLEDALELTLLVARKDASRHPRVAARWLQRYLEEDPAATIEEAGLAASALLALTGAGYQEAVQTLRAMSDRATRRRQERGVAWARAGPWGSGSWRSLRRPGPRPKIGTQIGTHLS
jgi:hypothetical protein